MTLPSLLAIIAGHDYEVRGCAVYAVSHADGMARRVCRLARWEINRAQLQAAESVRILRIMAIRPKVKVSKRVPPEVGIARLKAAVAAKRAAAAD